jgi:MFS superfamily sulfate permease-like transporter
LSALAAILLFTGYKLCNPATFKEMFANGKYQYVPFIVTVIAVVFTDLLTGVGFGLVVSIAAILIGNFKNSYFFKESSAGNTLTIQLAQEVSFLNKANIRATLDQIPEGKKVIIDATDTQYIDFDVLEIIKEFKEIKAPLHNIECELVGFHSSYKIANE